MTDLKTPAIVVNFKAYREVDGEGSLKLAKICESVSKDSGVTIAVCPPMVELGTVARAVDIPVFSQNADPHAPGSSTGWVTASMIKATGADQSFGTQIREQCDQRIGRTRKGR